MQKFFFLKVIFILCLIFQVSASEKSYKKQSSYKKNNRCQATANKCCSCNEKIDDSDLFKKDVKASFVNAEFLYWTPSAGSLEYAFEYTSYVPTAGAGTTYGLGEYKLADHGWDPSFRIAIGWFNAPKYWQVVTQFTWVRIKGSDTSSKNNLSNRPLVGSFAQNVVLGQELEIAKSTIKAMLELGDLLITRVFVPNPHLRLRVFGGLTGGSIRQVWNITYMDVVAMSEQIFNKWKFLGIGFRVGLDFDWFWGRHFYMTGKASLATLVGKHKYNGRINADTSGYFFQDVETSKYRGAYNAQFLLGPSYQRSLIWNRVEIFAGYELNCWLNVHEVLRTSGTTYASVLTTEQIPRINNGAFLLHGLTLRLSLDF